MTAPLDIHGILERAGADADAPEGSHAWALAQVGDAVAELIEAAKLVADYPTTSRRDRVHAILARFGVKP